MLDTFRSISIFRTIRSTMVSRVHGTGLSGSMGSSSERETLIVWDVERISSEQIYKWFQFIWQGRFGSLIIGCPPFPPQSYAKIFSFSFFHYIYINIFFWLSPGERFTHQNRSYSGWVSTVEKLFLTRGFSACTITVGIHKLEIWILFRLSIVVDSRHRQRPWFLECHLALTSQPNAIK